MSLPEIRLSLNWARRIVLLAWAKWCVLLIPVWVGIRVWGLHSAGTLLLVLVSVVAFAAMKSWEMSRRRQFIREARLPPVLVAQLRGHYPQLSSGDADLVLRGLRQFFMAYLRSDRRFVAMPSKVVDAAWHAFILHTRAYEAWCSAAFGRTLHHTPAEVLGRDPKRNDGLRRSWFWACKEESIDPRKPARLPLLFALDKKFAIAGGFTYVPDCRDIERQSGSDAYCGSSFGDGGSDAGGDADGFGGVDAAASSSDTASSSDSGGMPGAAEAAAAVIDRRGYTRNSGAMAHPDPSFLSNACTL